MEGNTSQQNDPCTNLKWWAWVFFFTRERDLGVTPVWNAVFSWVVQRAVTAQRLVESGCFQRWFWRSSGNLILPYLSVSVIRGALTRTTRNIRTNYMLLIVTKGLSGCSGCSEVGSWRPFSRSQSPPGHHWDLEPFWAFLRLLTYSSYLGYPKG